MQKKKYECAVMLSAIYLNDIQTHIDTFHVRVRLTIILSITILYSIAITGSL